MKLGYQLSKILNCILFLKDKPLLLPNKRYFAVTFVLGQILWLNKSLYSCKVLTLEQAVRLEQWLMRGWEHEKKSLCSITMRVLGESFSSGNLVCDSACVNYFLDLRALEGEGHYNQVLNELYGKGEPVFDALIYIDFVHLNFGDRQG